MRYLIGRYYFDSLFREQSNETFLEDLMKEPFIEEKNYEYALGDFHFEQTESYKFLRGTFGRIRKTDFSEVYDRTKKEFKQREIKESVDNKIEFIISHPHHLIFVAHHPYISHEYFAEKFKKIFNQTASFSEIEIDYIFEEMDVYKVIAKWDRLDKITFKKLRPSNPSSMDDFKDIEALIKETNSNRTALEFQATSSPSEESAEDKGLNTDSKLIRQALALSSQGYGEAKLKGTQNGKEVDVSTTRFIKRTEINFTEDGALEKLVQTIEEVQHKEKDGEK